MSELEGRASMVLVVLDEFKYLLSIVVLVYGSEVEEYPFDADDGVLEDKDVFEADDGLDDVFVFWLAPELKLEGYSESSEDLDATLEETLKVTMELEGIESDVS